MKRGRRRIAWALLWALLFLQAVGSAAAAQRVYFVATEENVLPVSDDTMPFWNNGYLYISSTIFTGIARESLDISHVQNEAGNTVVLYSGGRALLFERGKTHSQDTEGNTYYPGAVVRNGTLFVPAATVARFFDLRYSVTEVEHGYLVWLRRQDFTLSEQIFADAASYQLNNRYREYQQSLEPQQPEETPPVTPPVEIRGKRVYLCLKGDGNTAALLDVLDRYEAQGAVFCTADFMERQGDLLRRMVATGHSVGILTEDGDGAPPAAEQLERANRALERATCFRTRLALLPGADELEWEAAQEAGYCCFRPELDRSNASLRSSAQAEALLTQLSQRRGDVTVWLGTAVTAGGLQAFLAAAETADGQCLALTETA